MSFRRIIQGFVCCFLTLVVIGLFLVPINNMPVAAQEPNDEQGLLRISEPYGPAHSGQLMNLVSANTTDVLIVTGGSGPLTGISPIQEKDFWLDILSAMPGVLVDWYDGVPTFGLLDQYDLVIYDAGGYWYPLNDVVEVLTQYHYSGKPLIVVAPDINYDWSAHGSPVVDFCTGVLHIQGVLGIVPESTYQVYANTGHEMLFGIPSEIVISVPALTSWPDCFEPGPSCQGVLTTGFIPGTEFGVGTCSGLPSDSPYDPAGSLFDVVAYDGYGSEGRTLTFGFPISGLLNTQVARELARSSLIYCLSTVPTTYDLQVVASPPNPSVDDIVVFGGAVTSNGGNPVPDFYVGIEDPITQVSTMVITGLDGQFTYSVKASRAGEFRFLFFLEGVPTQCPVTVERIGYTWSNQALYIENPSEDSYEISVYLDDSLEGIYVINPGIQQTLWEAPDSLSSYDLSVVLENLSDGTTIIANISPYIQLNDTYMPVISDIPGNPSLGSFTIQSTDYMCTGNAESTACYIQSATDQPIYNTTIAEAGPLKIEASLDHGAGVEAEPYVEAGCGVFAGVRGRCEFSCSAGIAPVKLGFAWAYAPP